MSVCRPCVVCLLSVWRKSPSSAKPEGLKWKVMRNGIIGGVERNGPMNALTVTEPANADVIRSRILTIRGVQVMLDRDLAELYGVPTKRLNEQVKRNSERFPSTFMFHLANDEMRELVANCDRFKSMKHSSVTMTAFTEHGIIMLASVLKSKVAIEASIRITNTFVAMRRALATLAPLLSRIEATERRQLKQEDHTS